MNSSFYFKCSLCTTISDEGRQMSQHLLEVHKLSFSITSEAVASSSTGRMVVSLTPKPKYAERIEIVPENSEKLEVPDDNLILEESSLSDTEDPEQLPLSPIKVKLECVDIDVEHHVIKTEDIVDEEDRQIDNLKNEPDPVENVEMDAEIADELTFICKDPDPEYSQNAISNDLQKKDSSKENETHRYLFHSDGASAQPQQSIKNPDETEEIDRLQPSQTCPSCNGRYAHLEKHLKYDPSNMGNIGSHKRINCYLCGFDTPKGVEVHCFKMHLNIFTAMNKEIDYLQKETAEIKHNNSILPTLSHSDEDIEEEQTSAISEEEYYADETEPRVCKAQRKNITETNKPIMKRNGQTSIQMMTNFTTCRICKGQFISRIGLKQHMNKMHNNLQNSQNTIIRFKCYLCNRGFRNKKYFDIHCSKMHSRNWNPNVSQHTEIESRPLSAQEEQEQPKFIFIPPGNPQKFIDEAAYDNQDTSEQNQDNLNNFQSEVPNSESTLQTAAAVIKNPSRKCTECLASFASPSRLERHLKSHGTNYKCVECPAGFKFEVGLIRHQMRMHNMYKSKAQKAKPNSEGPPQLSYNLLNCSRGALVCSECGDSFNDYRILKRHKKLHGTTVMCSVPECSAGFHSDISLRKHLMRMHVK